MKTQSIDFNKADLSPKGSVLSLGGFDGIHPGHQTLIQELVREAGRRKASSCLCVFDPLPFQFLRDLRPFKRLFTIEETEELLRPFGLDFFCIIPFNQSFSRLCPEDFVSSFIVPHFAPVQIIAGYDFSFGHKREGGFFLLKKLAGGHGFSARQISARRRGDQPISSSRIRKCLLSAHIEELKSLLGRSFSVQGRVLSGDGRGRKLGFPTANLQPEQKELPPFGVYGGRAKTEDLWHKAVINIGCRPTFALKGGPCLVEVHILSGELDLYGENLTVELDFFIRKEKAFSTDIELKTAIERDIEKVLARK